MKRQKFTHSLARDSNVMFHPVCGFASPRDRRIASRSTAGRGFLISPRFRLETLQSWGIDEFPNVERLKSNHEKHILTIAPFTAHALLGNSRTFVRKMENRT
jgi:hypothetical protein